MIVLHYLQPANAGEWIVLLDWSRELDSYSLLPARGLGAFELCQSWYYLVSFVCVPHRADTPLQIGHGAQNKNNCYINGCFTGWNKWKVSITVINIYEESNLF